MGRSSKPIRGHIKTNDLADRSFIANSNSCSSGIHTVSIFTMSTNSRVSKKKKV